MIEKMIIEFIIVCLFVGVVYTIMYFVSLLTIWIGTIKRKMHDSKPARKFRLWRRRR